MNTPWPDPDFLASHDSRRPVIAWLWAAAALGVLTLTLVDWRAAAFDLDAQRQRLARATLRLAKPRAPAQGVSPASDAEAVRSARLIADRLAHPWGQVIGDVEVETPPGLQWLALDHEVDDAGVRLEGAAPDIVSVLHFVDSLADHGGWSDVALMRLRSASGPEAASNGGWRFELHATVDARRMALARPREDR